VLRRLRSCQISPTATSGPAAYAASRPEICARNGYDFPAIWYGERMERSADPSATGSAACPLANASYTNIMLSPVALAKAGFNYAKLTARPCPGRAGCRTKGRESPAASLRRPGRRLLVISVLKAAGAAALLSGAAVVADATMVDRIG